jgi:hypothetical protein
LAIELRRQDFIEAPNVGILRRGDEVKIERGEFVDVVGHGFRPDARQSPSRRWTLNQAEE